MVNKKIISEQLAKISMECQPDVSEYHQTSPFKLVEVAMAKPEYRIYQFTNELGAILRNKHFEELNDEDKG